MGDKHGDGGYRYVRSKSGFNSYTVDNQRDQRIRQASCKDVTSRENLARGSKLGDNFYERPNELAFVKVYMVSLLIAT